jgi:hypothetical protein
MSQMRFGSFSLNNPRFTPFPADWPARRAGIGDHELGPNARSGVPPAPDIGAVLRGEVRMPNLLRVHQEVAAKRDAERERQRAAAGPVDRTVPQPPSLIPAGVKLIGAPEATEEVSRW